MSNIIRWEPAREMVTLRDAMDHLFDEAFTRPFRLYDDHLAAPAVDMYQTENEVVIKIAIPGVKAEDVQINLTGEVLNIKGETREKEEKSQKAYHIREQHFGMFERSLTLPTMVDPEKSKAEFENGVLTITLPKSEQVRPKTIPIKAK